MSGRFTRNWCEAGAQTPPLLRASSPLKPKNQLRTNIENWYCERGHFTLFTARLNCKNPRSKTSWVYCNKDKVFLNQKDCTSLIPRPRLGKAVVRVLSRTVVPDSVQLIDLKPRRLGAGKIPEPGSRPGMATLGGRVCSPLLVRSRGHGLCADRSQSLLIPLRRGPDPTSALSSRPNPLIKCLWGVQHIGLLRPTWSLLFKLWLQQELGCVLGCVVRRTCSKSDNPRLLNH